MFAVIATLPRRVKVAHLITSPVYMPRQQTLGTLSSSPPTLLDAFLPFSKIHHHATWEETTTTAV